MAPKRRRLSDLYVRGMPIKIDDGQGEPVDVWMQKMNPLEQQNALRRAGAERAKQLALVKKRDSDEWGATYAEIVDFADHESLVTIAIREEMTITRLRVEMEVAAEEEWSKDDYLTGLIDLWNEGGMERVYAEDPDDPEAKQVKAEMERFDKQVQALVEAEEVKLRRDYDSVPLEELRETATDKLMEERSTTAFIEEFEVQQIKYSVRDPDKKSEYYFKDREEILGLDQEVRKILSDNYRILAVDPIEGKGSAGNPASSASSAQPEPAETSEVSGPQDAKE